MGLKSFLQSCIRLIKMVGRPEPKEVWASMRIGLIGLAVLGVIGFIIKVLATMLIPTEATTATT